MTVNQNQSNTCDDFELLISCCRDGEIDADEKLQLDTHLKQCTACRDIAIRFAEVDDAVAAMGDDAPQPADARSESLSNNKTTGLTRSTRSMKSKRSFLSVAAFAAAVMIGTSIFYWDWQVVQPENSIDIVGPIVSLSEINSQRIHDQEMMRESMEYDLRTLKLQLLTQGKSTDADASDQMLLRINELMGKIEQTKIINQENTQ